MRGSRTLPRMTPTQNGCALDVPGPVVAHDSPALAPISRLDHSTTTIPRRAAARQLGHDSNNADEDDCTLAQPGPTKALRNATTLGAWSRFSANTHTHYQHCSQAWSQTATWPPKTSTMFDQHSNSRIQSNSRTWHKTQGKHQKLTKRPSNIQSKSTKQEEDQSSIEQAPLPESGRRESQSEGLRETLRGERARKREGSIE